MTLCCSHSRFEVQLSVECLARSSNFDPLRLFLDVTSLSPLGKWEESNDERGKLRSPELEPLGPSSGGQETYVNADSGNKPRVFICPRR